MPQHPLSHLLVCLLMTATVLAFAACDDSTSGSPDLSSDATETDTLPTACTPGERSCWDGKLATCMPDGSGWLLEACPDEEQCVDGLCQADLCQPGTFACAPDGVIICLLNRTWSEPEPCDAGQSCVAGACIDQTCSPNDRLCQNDRVLICQDDGVTWEEELCDPGWFCFLGACVECVRDQDCSGGLCELGVCRAIALSVATEALLDGMLAQPYAASLAAKGGTTPYTWSIATGALPPGISLAASGAIQGTPTAAGAHHFTVQVTDGANATAEKALVLYVHPEGLVISTSALPAGEEGLDYDTSLAALGGASPYFWGVVAGALPDGLSLTSSGRIFGVPNEIGTFPITFRVFDALLPPSTAEKELPLTIKIAPLVIYGDQEYDLLFTKAIILPMLTIIEGLPLPYSTKLTARGGLRPYTWTEVPIPSALSWLIPKAGIPPGLTLASDGTLSGSVTSTDLVITVRIPLTDIELTGFFFMARVTDSQAPAESKEALFLIPTIPIGG